MSLSILAQIISTLLGLCSSYLLTQGDGRGWPAGASMVALCAYVYWTESLYGSFGLQLVFLAIQLVGWWRWNRGQHSDLCLSSRRMKKSHLWGVAALWLTGAFFLGRLLTLTGGQLPWLDGLATSGNLLAQTCLVFGFSECWLIWTLTNLVYIALASLCGLYPYVALYAIYIGLAVKGWKNWTRASE